MLSKESKKVIFWNSDKFCFSNFALPIVYMPREVNCKSIMLLNEEIWRLCALGYLVASGSLLVLRQKL